MNMTEFNRQLAKKSKELDDLIRRKLPVKVGNMAKAHYQDNIRQGGFVNNGLQSWQKTKRQQSGSKSATANYGALLSSRKHLYSSIKSVPSDYRVKVSNDVEYAPVHNWGGTVSPAVTKKMRKFAWAMYYKEAGIRMGKKEKEARQVAKGQGKTLRGKRTEKQREKLDSASDTAKKWKGLALTKKEKLNIKIPQRQFLGESSELNDSIRQTIDREIRKIINN
jgi:phage gpG-like protein